MISAGHAEHDSVRRLLESRYAAATVEVSEALRERVCRSIDNADVIEREVLAGFAAPLDSYLRIAAHGRARKLETASTGSTPGIICGVGLAFARAWYSWLEGLAARVRKYCGPGPGLCHDADHIQHFPTVHFKSSIAIKANLWRFARRYSAFPSDCRADALLQVIVRQRVAEHCPRNVRVSNAS